MARKQPTPGASASARSPLDFESTAWGRQQERRHAANLRAIKDIRDEMGTVKTELADNTVLTKSIDSRLSKLVDSTEPYVKLRQAVIKSSENAKILGRYTTAVVDWLLRYGKAGAILVGTIALVRSWAHGESPIEALKTMWQIVAH